MFYVFIYSNFNKQTLLLVNIIRQNPVVLETIIYLVQWLNNSVETRHLEIIMSGAVLV